MAMSHKEQEREDRLQRLIREGRIASGEARSLLDALREVRRVERVAVEAHRREQSGQR